MTPKQLIKRNEKRVYHYYSENKKKMQPVYCDYMSYLFLKMCYGRGLTEAQYRAYKEYSCK